MKKSWLGKIMLNLAVLSLVFVFLGCGDDEDEDDDSLSISKITIYNIPANIPVNGNSSKSNETFKVYLNASDYQEADKPPAAQGFKKVTPAMLKNGKYTVTIPLRKPAPNKSEDPNDDGGAWKGTAKNFSLMIVPYDVSVDKVNAIWVKGSMTLNKSKARLDWESEGIMNFRDPNFAGPPLSLADKADSLFTDVVCKDPDIKSKGE